MALHTEPTSPDMANKKVFNLKPTEGRFSVYDPETEETSQVAAVEGVVKYVSVVHDPGTAKSKGNKGYDPYEAFLMLLEDGDEAYRIKADVRRAYSYIVASCMHGFGKGDRIKITVTLGDNQQSTLASLEVWDSEEGDGGAYRWIKPEPMGSNLEEKIEKGEEIIRAHDAWIDIKPAE